MRLNQNHRLTMAGLGGLLALSLAVPAVSQEAAKTSATPPGAKAEAASSPAPSVAQGKAVASYSLGNITQAEVDRMIGVQLTRLRQQIFDMETRTIRQMVAERLLRAQALREGMTRDQFYDMYVTKRIAEPTDAQVAQVMKQYRSQLPKDDKAAQKLVRQAIKDREKQRLENALQTAVLRDAKLRIFLEVPRFPVVVNKDDPVRGPADAPVTIVEFSDFQCPYCARVQTTLHKILETYPTQVRIVFKNMPGQRHDRARPAAEAALCAGRQGKFWEMHDWLYAHQAKLDDESLKAEAKELGLEMDPFTACLSKHEFSAQINAGLKEARELGLNGTPIFFVNGRMIRGAQPFKVFDDTIRAELKRLGIQAPPVAKTAAGEQKDTAPKVAGEAAPVGGQAKKH